MKSSKLHEEIKENLKDYPIEYLRNKVTDDRYKRLIDQKNLPNTIQKHGMKFSL